MPTSRATSSAHWSASRAGGAVRILDALFVASDPETRELVAVDLTGDRAAASLRRCSASVARQNERSASIGAASR
jgi:hypothetical protein